MLRASQAMSEKTDRAALHLRSDHSQLRSSATLDITLIMVIKKHKLFKSQGLKARTLCFRPSSADFHSFFLLSGEVVQWCRFNLFSLLWYIKRQSWQVGLTVFRLCFMDWSFRSKGKAAVERQGFWVSGLQLPQGVSHAS